MLEDVFLEDMLLVRTSRRLIFLGLLSFGLVMMVLFIVVRDESNFHYNTNEAMASLQEQISQSDIIMEPWVMHEFLKWVRKYNKIYNSAGEANYRMRVFKENLQKIYSMSREPISFQIGQTQFADLTTEEFKSIYLNKNYGYLLKNREGKETFRYEKLASDYDGMSILKTKIDWREKGGVTEVKDQGICSASWAFAATGALEGSYFLKSSGNLVSFSEQELIDCSQDFGNGGCDDGGLMDWAYEYTQSRGIQENTTYKYKGTEGRCSYQLSEGMYRIERFVNVKKNDSVQLTLAVLRQPVSVFLRVDPDVFQFYNGGILNFTDCGPHLNHAALIVGYDNEKLGEGYWILKNSWGKDWGEEGYFRIAKINQTAPGICGITEFASFPFN